MGKAKVQLKQHLKQDRDILKSKSFLKNIIVNPRMN